MGLFVTQQHNGICISTVWPWTLGPTREIKRKRKTVLFSYIGETVVEVDPAQLSVESEPASVKISCINKGLGVV